jgi:hypothetical protein
VSRPEKPASAAWRVCNGSADESCGHFSVAWAFREYKLPCPLRLGSVAALIGQRGKIAQSEVALSRRAGILRPLIDNRQVVAHSSHGG